MTYHVGDCVYWTDPDGDLCSGPGVVIAVQNDSDDPTDEQMADDVITIRRDMGVDVETLPCELRKIRV